MADSNVDTIEVLVRFGTRVLAVATYLVVPDFRPPTRDLLVALLGFTVGGLSL